MPSEVLTQYKSLLLVMRSWEVILGLTVYVNLSLYKNAADFLYQSNPHQLLLEPTFIYFIVLFTTWPYCIRVTRLPSI